MADNLLDKASILLTPTAYNDGSMLSVKPNENLYGSELVTNGDFSNGLTNWSVNGGSYATIVDGALNSNNTENGSWFAENVSQDVSFVSGKTYKIFFKARNISGDSNLRITHQSHIVFSNNLTSSFVDYTIYYTAQANNDSIRIFCNDAVGQFQIDNVSIVEDLTGDFTFSRSSAATRVNAQGLVENVQIISSELVSNGNFSQIGTEEVSNGNFSQEGSELVTNGDFATDSDWTKNSGWSIGGGVASCDGVGINSLQQSGITTIGKTYKLTFDVLSSNDFDFLIISTNFGDTYIDADIDGVSLGTNTFYITPTNGTGIRFRVGDGTTLSIDNVSVKEVGQDWSFSSGASLTSLGAKITHTPTAGSVSQPSVLTIGKSYKLTYEITESVSGGLKFNSAVDASMVTTVGVHTKYLEADATTASFSRTSSSNNDVTITNISVKEVGQDWTLSNGSISDKYNASMTAYQSGIKITPFSKTGKYKVVFDLVVTSGSCRFDVGGGNDEIYTTSGTKEKLITNPTKFEFNAFNLGWVGTLDNVSVKEITDDTDLPRIDYEGFSYQDSLGSEEVVNGDFATDTNWTKASNWTISGGSANADGSSGGQLSQTTSSVVVGKTYKIQYTILNYVSGSFRFSYAGTSESFNTSNGTYTTYRVATSTANALASSSISFIGSIDNVSVKEYLGQEVVPDSGCGSWLLEPQSTNLVIESESFSSWNKDASVSITSTDKSSPLGTNNASEITVTDSGRLYHDPTISTTADRVTSIFIKGGTFVNFKFTCIVSSEIDLNAETATNNFDIQKLTNGWFRISTTAQSVTSTSRRIQLQAYPDNTYTNGHGQTGTYSIIGTQMENTLLTSYIPTTNGATNTRLQDIANNSGNSTLINSTEGVLYAEIAALREINNNLQFLSLGSGLYTNNSIYIQLRSAANQFAAWAYSNGVNQLAELINVTDIKQFNKIAISYKLNDFKVYVNGSVVYTNATYNPPTTNSLNVLEFARDGVLNFHGKAKALAVFKDALTDEQLQSLTTI